MLSHLPGHDWPKTKAPTTLRTVSRLAFFLLRFFGVLGAVAAITTVDLRLLHVNSATAAFSFLLLILALATWTGLQESITASFASMLAYNFFFLPPVGTFTISDPQNWVALFVFMATAITASHLSSSARRRAEEAGFRQQELQRMYDFSRALMLRGDERSLADQITQNLSELFGFQDVWFYDRRTDSVCKIATQDSPLEESLLRDVAAGGKVWRNADQAALIIPVGLGGRLLGSLGVCGTTSTSEVALQAMAQLIAIIIERARAEEAATRAEATRQNEQLKATLLDALAHEFKTPLTSIKAAATTLLSRNKLDSIEHEMLSVVDEESDHLNSLVSEAIELARIGAGPVVLHRESCSVDELVSSAVSALRGLWEGRIIERKVQQNLPLIEIDRKLGELAVRQLLNNALKYSSPSSTIQLMADSQGDAVVIRVINSGGSIPKFEQDLIFEKFYRGREVRARVAGTGMGLAIAREIAEAHGGRLWLEREFGRGVEFALSLPTVISPGLLTNRRSNIP